MAMLNAEAKRSGSSLFWVGKSRAEYSTAKSTKDVQRPQRLQQKLKPNGVSLGTFAVKQHKIYVSPLLPT